MLQDRVKTFYSKCFCFQMEFIYYSLYVDLNSICILLLPPFLSLLLSSAFELECILHPKWDFTQLLYTYVDKMQGRTRTQHFCDLPHFSALWQVRQYGISHWAAHNICQDNTESPKNPRKQLASLFGGKKLEKPFTFKYPNWLPSVTLNLI